MIFFFFLLYYILFLFSFLYSFGSAKKESIYENTLKKTKLIPGPGSYIIENKILARSNSLIRYLIYFLYWNLFIFSFGFGKEKKLKDLKSLTPGPGNYYKEKEVNKSIKNIG